MTDERLREALDALHRDIGRVPNEVVRADLDAEVANIRAALSDPRPDSGIEARERELRKRLTQHHRDQHLTAGTCRSCLAVLGRLSTLRTETSEP